MKPMVNTLGFRKHKDLLPAWTYPPPGPDLRTWCILKYLSTGSRNSTSLLDAVIIENVEELPFTIRRGFIDDGDGGCC
jgi:hypothetical protein